MVFILMVVILKGDLFFIFLLLLEFFVIGFFNLNGLGERSMLVFLVVGFVFLDLGILNVLRRFFLIVVILKGWEELFFVGDLLF